MLFRTIAIGTLFCMCMNTIIAGVYFSPFLGIELGAQRIQIKGGSLDNFLGMPDYQSSTQYNIASRYSLGFYISHKFSIEFSYNALHSYVTELTIKTIAGDATGTVYRKLSGYDFLAYGYLPINRWSIYIGGGITLINTHYLPASIYFDGMIFPYDLNGRRHNDFIRPKAAISLGYHLRNNIMLSVAYARIFHAGKTLQENITLYVPAIDFMSIGITIILHTQTQR